MPENEEPDAPLTAEELQKLVDEETVRQQKLLDAERKRHPSKSDRWGIEDKVVEPDTK